jgi:heme-degrading monooxygenase HmoA
MICRVGIFNGPPELRPWVVEAAMTEPGCRGVYHLRRRDGKGGLSISLWDDEQAAKRGAEAITKARPEGYEGAGPDEVEWYEVAEYATR